MQQNPNWQEAYQLSIYKHSKGVELLSTGIEFLYAWGIAVTISFDRAEDAPVIATVTATVVADEGDQVATSFPGSLHPGWGWSRVSQRKIRPREGSFAC